MAWDGWESIGQLQFEDIYSNGTCDNSTLHFVPSPIDNDLYNNTPCCIEKSKKSSSYIQIYHTIIHFLWSGGCPIYKQDWCGYLPGIHSIQMILGFLFIVTGYPMGSAMSNAIYSKVIGPHPQVLIN